MRYWRNRLAPRSPTALGALIAAMAYCLSAANSVVCDEVQQPAERECVLDTRRLITQVLSGDVRQGNQGLAECDFLCRRLDNVAADSIADPATAFAKRRALAWARLFTSRHSASADLLRFIDVRVPDHIDTGSSIQSGPGNPVLYDMRNRGLVGISPVMQAVGSVSRSLSDRQETFLGLSVADALGRDMLLVTAYIGRFRERARGEEENDMWTRVELVAGAAIWRERIKVPPEPSAEEVSARWKRRKREVLEEFPLKALSRYRPIGKPETEALAQEIVRLTDIGPEGDLGLLHGLMGMVSNELLKEIDKSHLVGLPIDAQLQKVKRAMLLLAILRNPRIADVLVQRIEERIVLDDPDGMEAFREVDIADLCVEYGDGIIEPIMNFVGSSAGNELSEESMNKYATILLRACGDRPADRLFLQMYVERKTKIDRIASLRRLVKAIGEVTLQNSK